MCTLTLSTTRDTSVHIAIPSSQRLSYARNIMGLDARHAEKKWFVISPNGRVHTTRHHTLTPYVYAFAHLSGADRRAAVQTCVRPPHVIHETFDDVQHLATLREQENPVTLQCPGGLAIRRVHACLLYTSDAADE